MLHQFHDYDFSANSIHIHGCSHVFEIVVSTLIHISAIGCDIYDSSPSLNEIFTKKLYIYCRSLQRANISLIAKRLPDRIRNIPNRGS